VTHKRTKFQSAKLGSAEFFEDAAKTAEIIKKFCLETAGAIRANDDFWTEHNHKYAILWTEPLLRQLQAAYEKKFLRG